MTILPEQRRTKIVCTMGPACKGSVLPRLVAAGMNVARLNFSHGTQEEHGDWIRRIREVSERLKTPVAILQDLAGPKVRIGEAPDGETNLEEGDEFFLVAGSVTERQKSVTVNYPQIIAETPVGAAIRLADGNLELFFSEICPIMPSTRRFGYIKMNLSGVKLGETPPTIL
jgi:pyruvate kinase